jgi:hypothetical protein
MKSIEAVEGSCRESLSRPELRDVAAALKRDGVTTAQCLAWLRSVTEVPESQEPINRLRASLVQAGRLADGGYELEQYLLLVAALDSLPRVAALPTGEDVHRLFGEAFTFLAQPDARSLQRFRCGSPDFGAMCRVATLRRFPAGQFEWELSGIPRSWLFKVDRSSLPRLLRLIALELGGFKPLIFPHFTACGPRRIALREDAVKRAFYRMAVAMEMQPGVRGFLAAAFFLSPDVLKINPQLSWFLPIFLENGGYATTMGETELGSRQLGADPALRAKYDRGEFRPRLGVVVWPRKAMLGWAARHPELADAAPRPAPAHVTLAAATIGDP